MTDHEPTPGALQAARSLHSIEVELPDGWKVQRIITELGLRRIAAVLDAFAAEAVAAERERFLAELSRRYNERYAQAEAEGQSRAGSSLPPTNESGASHD